MSAETPRVSSLPTLASRSRLLAWNNGLRLLAVLLCGLLICFYTETTVKIIPPTDPSHPVVVYLLDYGMHSGLLLPVGPGRYVEYLYGDWNWAALNHNGTLDALKALFMSPQAVLGFRYITQAPGQPMPLPPEPVQSEVAITVNGDGCQRVLAEMDARWQASRSTALTANAPNGGFWCVKDHQGYSWLHDCNLYTVHCLLEMGCQVRGYAVWSKFYVRKS